VQRPVTGFHQDDEGDWVAELDCLHAQHARHDPPIWPRPWVLTAEGRRGHLGTLHDCPGCDRAELPDGLRLARTAGPFDADTMPRALQAAHVVARGTWGRLRVLDGSVRFAMSTEPPVDDVLVAGDEQPIPPGVEYAVSLTGPATVAVDFLVRDPPR
jgi:tellurite resistance-related uncharacterized protein